MTSGAYVGSRGVRRSYGGVAALADLGSRLRLGITGQLGPDSAAKAALMRPYLSCRACMARWQDPGTYAGRGWLSCALPSMAGDAAPPAPRSFRDR
jgi:hypothetical protein